MLMRLFHKRPDTGASLPDFIAVRSLDDITAAVLQVREAARLAHDWIARQSDDPIEFLKSVKFEKKGYHPVTHHALNLIEQVNQTWTYLVAFEATKLLMKRHPEALGFTLAPGASAFQELDIMSVRSGLVGAETFAVTCLRSNNKFRIDMAKMARRTEQHRYIYVACPQYCGTEWRSELDASGVEVWSVDLTA